MRPLLGAAHGFSNLIGFPGRLTAGDLADRDLLVVDTMRGRDIPLAMVLSGGYSAESWKIHADDIEGILARFDGG